MLSCLQHFAFGHECSLNPYLLCTDMVYNTGKKQSNNKRDEDMVSNKKGFWRKLKKLFKKM